jgi:RNA polymerase sigma-70 factor (sigma-E family)
MAMVSNPAPPTAPQWAPALVELYQARYAPLVRLAYLLTGSPAAAEELVQEAFIATHRGWGRVRQPAAYVRTAVVNNVRSWGRRTQLEHAHRATTLPPLAHQEPDELWDALGALPERQRVAIVLRFYEDLPDHEIAHVLGCRPGTVRTAIHRGLAALRKEIER